MGSTNGNLVQTSEHGEERSAADEVLQLKLELAAKDSAISQLKERNLELLRDKANLELAFNGVLDSLSWKITAPLRSGLAVFRELYPFLSFRRTPCRQRPFEAAEGLAPQCRELLPEPGYRYPSGWSLISAKVESETPHQFYSLYHDRGEGFVVREKVTLPFSNEDTISHLVKLPRGIKRLRIDPFDTESPGKLREVRFQGLGSIQVLFFLLNKHVLSTLAHPKTLKGKVSKFLALWRLGGLAALKGHLLKENYSDNYQEWVKKNDTLSEKDHALIRGRIESLQYKPLISVLMPVYNTPAEYLSKAIDSVLGQLYPNWELCIADDCSTAPHIKQLLSAYAARESRIKLVFRDSNGHISAASNSALELATGEFIALLDHDDQLREHALFMIAERLNRKRDADLIYSDEDKVTAFGARVNPYFKSDWNPELLLSQNYICHLVCFRTALVRKLGGFRVGFEGAQDWDLILRVADASKIERIEHIPHILYHWRMIEGSTAQATAFKPYVLEAQRKAVSEHLERRGVRAAQVEIQHDIAQLKVRYALPSPAPLVSIIIPTKDGVKFLKRAVSSVLNKTSYKNIEIIVVDNGSEKQETLSYLDSIKSDSRITILKDPRPFNYSRMNNFAVKQSKGELICLLNNDIEVITPNWLGELVSLALQPQNGAVGARLLYPNDTIQHAGVILGIGGVAGHSHKCRVREDVGYFNRVALRSNFSAVTAACLVVRKVVFEQVGGLDEEELSVAFNDVDFCLKVGRAGYLNIYTPYAELYHFESVSRGYEITPTKFARFENEVETMKKRWGAALKQDPFYNPNLSLVSEDFTFAFPTRAEKPWLEKR